MKKEDFPLNEHSVENAHRVAFLIAGHIRKTLSALERNELDVWLEESEKNIELFEELTDQENLQRALDWYSRLRKENSLQRIKQRIRFTPQQKQGTLSFFKLSVAASLILLISVAVYFLALKKSRIVPEQYIATEKVPQEMAPGGNKAILTLSNGQKIVLDSASNGALAIQGNTQVLKNDSTLSYNANLGVGIKQNFVFNVLETPRGGQYKIVLSDGTIVWLNAASSLKYPTAFTTKERLVELTGEAYFEVAHISTQPFKVIAGGVVMEDLGTEFNINSYRDEGVLKTTLVEGVVKVIKGAVSKVLKPGQEALVSENGIKIVNADIEAVTGWKSGNFVFHRTPISTVMKNLERWYGVAILNKESNTKHLVATIKRNVPLSKMLYYLEKTGDVHFEWRGKNLIVLP